MNKKLKSTKADIVPLETAINPAALLYALPTAVLTIDRQYRIHSLNPAAEDFLGASEAALIGKEIAHCLYPVSRLLALLSSAFEKQAVVRDYDAEMHGPRVGHGRVNMQATPLPETPHLLLLTIEKQIAAINRHSGPGHEFSRSAASMAAILAHELKNPLSGIKGAAQLLQKKVSTDDAKLTGLIASEVDRISGLINEMEIFSDESPVVRTAVNIHEVLQHVKYIAENGFASNVQFIQRYDPSLPHVLANRDQLVQLFLNLVKNAAEALVDTTSPIITLSTGYVSGPKYRWGDTDAFYTLPIQVAVEDNGPGIPDAVRAHLFDPFVTTKQGGHGLGLTVVSKIAASHGAALDIERTNEGSTRFKVMLPAAR